MTDEQYDRVMGTVQVFQQALQDAHQSGKAQEFAAVNENEGFLVFAITFSEDQYHLAPMFFDAIRNTIATLWPHVGGRTVEVQVNTVKTPGGGGPPETIN